MMMEEGSVAVQQVQGVPSTSIHRGRRHFLLTQRYEIAIGAVPLGLFEHKDKLKSVDGGPLDRNEP